MLRNSKILPCYEDRRGNPCKRAVSTLGLLRQGFFILNPKNLQHHGTIHKKQFGYHYTNK